MMNRNVTKVLGLILLGTSLLATTGARAVSATTPVTLKSWHPDKEVRAVVVGLHNHGDYHAAFDHLGRWFSRQGVAVYAYDQPGFGARENAGEWPGHEALEDDLVSTLCALRKHYDVPVIVIGESLGGAVAINVATSEHGNLIDGLVLAAPAVREGITLRYGWNLLIGGAAMMAPDWALQVERSADDPRFHPASAQRLASDPLVHRQVNLSAYWGLIRMADRASDRLPRVSQPVMLLYGGQDTSVPAVSIDRARQHLAARNNAFSYHHDPEGIHLLLQSKDWQTYASNILGWIDEQLHQGLLSRPHDQHSRQQLAGCPV